MEVGVGEVGAGCTGSCGLSEKRIGYAGMYWSVLLGSAASLIGLDKILDHWSQNENAERKIFDILAEVNAPA